MVVLVVIRAARVQAQVAAERAHAAQVGRRYESRRGGQRGVALTHQGMRGNRVQRGRRADAQQTIRGTDIT